jgi:DNA-binding PadR family transcriptional regulator
VSIVKKRDHPAEGRRALALRPEFLVLGLLAEDSAHGYKLYRRFVASLDGLWHISESQFYATLKRIEARGWIEACSPAKGKGGSKRLLSLSGEGRRVLLEWIDTPTIGSPKLVHMEFLTRLFFARRLAPRKVKRIVADQAASLEKDIDRIASLGGVRGAKNDINDLSIAFRERQLRAAIEWVEKNVAPAIRRRSLRPPGA